MLEGKYVYGIDGTPEAKEMVSEGKMAATVAQSPKTFGKKTGEVIYKMFSQEKIKNKNEVNPVQNHHKKTMFMIILRRAGK